MFFFFLVFLLSLWARLLENPIKKKREEGLAVIVSRLLSVVCCRFRIALLASFSRV